MQTVERGLCMYQRRVNLVILAELSLFSNELFYIKNHKILTFGQTWVRQTIDGIVDVRMGSLLAYV